MKMHWILQELIASGPGRIGVGLFSTLVLVSLYVVVTYPSDFGSARWSNPAVWADHPKAAPPSWVNHLSDRKRPIHRVMDSTTPDKVTVAEGVVVRLYRFPFEYWAGEVPSFLSLSFGEVVFQEHPPNLIVSLLRPDGQETILHQQVVGAHVPARLLLTAVTARPHSVLFWPAGRKSRNCLVR